MHILKITVKSHEISEAIIVVHYANHDLLMINKEEEEVNMSKENIDMILESIVKELESDSDINHTFKTLS
tara:strand:+ start:95 stop:304 length:210 start_codon:yes stop_codon:yes gene_type:complete